MCALPSNSLSGDCITGASNEPDDCGYSTNLIGLCTYCAKSSPNATDTCCYHADLSKCDSIHIPTTSALPPLVFPSVTATSTPSPSNSSSSTAAASPKSGLSGGQIAGIVVGSIVGAALLAALIVALCIFMRRRRGSQSGSVFNQPTPAQEKWKWHGI